MVSEGEKVRSKDNKLGQAGPSCAKLGQAGPSWAKLSPRKGSREVGNALMNQFIAKGRIVLKDNRIVLKDNRTFLWKPGIRIRRRLSAN